MNTARLRPWVLLVVLSLLVPCGPSLAATCTTSPWLGLAGVPPLTEFPPGYLYLGRYAGFLYDGSNSAPADHDADGRALRQKIVPRDTAGNACAAGAPGCRIVFLAIGASNTTIEICGGTPIGRDADSPAASPCPLPTAPTPYIQPQSFIGQATQDAAVNHATLLIADGAKGNEPLAAWDPTASGWTQYQRVLNDVLLPAHLSQYQVQAIWIDDANTYPSVSLAGGTAARPSDAVVAERHLGNIVRAIRSAYPNAVHVFLSSRIYAGYGNSAQPPNALIPEPYAFEGGFTVKWLVQAQVDQVRGLAPAPDAGALDYRTGAAPWIGWGPYLWANGSTPRKDGLAWLNSDFRYPYNPGPGVNECEHESTYGEKKVATQLLQFVKTSPYTPWFLAAGPACTLGYGSLALAGDRRTLSWATSGALPRVDVARGDIGQVLASHGNFGGAVCLANDLAANSTTDGSIPSSGAGHFYLVRCAGDTWNDATQTGNRDATLTGCP